MPSGCAYLPSKCDKQSGTHVTQTQARTNTNEHTRAYLCRKTRAKFSGTEVGEEGEVGDVPSGGGSGVTLGVT